MQNDSRPPMPSSEVQSSSPIASHPLHRHGSMSDPQSTLTEAQSYQQIQDPQSFTDQQQQDYGARPYPVTNDSSSSNHSQRSALLDDIAGAYLLRQEKVSKSRDRVSKMRDRLLNELASFHDHQRFVHESQQQFMEAIDKASRSRDPSSMRTQIRDLYEAIHLDQSVLNATTKKVHDIENRLGGLENVLKKREDKLKMVTEKLVEVMRSRNPALTPATTDFDIASETSAGSMHTYQSSVANVSPVLLQYWDRKGEVNVMRERFASVEMDYHEARGQRNFYEDQDKQLEESEAEFDSYWKSELANTQSELQRALLGFQEARQACISAGLVPFVGKAPPVEDEDAHPEPDGSGVNDPSLVTLRAYRGSGGFLHSDALSPQTFPLSATPNEIVTEWVQTQSATGQAQEPVSPPEIETDPGLLHDPAHLPTQVRGLSGAWQGRVDDWLRTTTEEPRADAPLSANRELSFRLSTAAQGILPSRGLAYDTDEMTKRRGMEVYSCEVLARSRIRLADMRAYIPPRSVSETDFLQYLLRSS